ncbi:MAG: glycosyltransferase family 2 protein [Candidatus Moranbacteria bacterium]|nr:glycosyltransferase family 2 protein [Candidatus Moranbacteria bacterium]
MTEKIFIVIPAFNEEAVIQEVIDEAKKSGYENIIIVDDGSSDDTFQKAKERNVFALRHKINRGKGAAAKTGIEAAKLLGAEIAVTMDADGQHNPADIAKMIQLLENGHDVVLGTRLQNPAGMPQYKIFANRIGNFFTWMIYGLWVTDSQSGFRAYSKRAMEQIDTRTDHYEYDSEVIREIRRNQLKHVEIPIEVRYTEYSMGKLQKQGFVNGLKTLYNMIWSIIS